MTLLFGTRWCNRAAVLFLGDPAYLRNTKHNYYQTNLCALLSLKSGSAPGRSA